MIYVLIQCFNLKTNNLKAFDQLFKIDTFSNYHIFKLINGI